MLARTQTQNKPTATCLPFQWLAGSPSSVSLSPPTVDHVTLWSVNPTSLLSRCPKPRVETRTRSRTCGEYISAIQLQMENTYSHVYLASCPIKRQLGLKKDYLCCAHCSVCLLTTRRKLSAHFSRENAWPPSLRFSLSQSLTPFMI